MKYVSVERSFFRLKKAGRKVVIDFLVNRLKAKHGCTLVERTFRRAKHLCHQMHLAARENEMCIVDELNVGAQQCLRALLGIICDGLELIDGNIHFLARLFQVIKNALNRVFRF